MVCLHGLQLVLVLQVLLVLLLLHPRLHLPRPAPAPALGEGHEVGHDVDGDREDDGGVVLGRDAVQGLEIPQLKDGKMLIITSVVSGGGYNGWRGARLCH